MRVIAGNARGVRLVAPAGLQTRPTSDRVKEALFSIIENRFMLADAVILDICAGTGALGIEALSRNAASCCFIEKERRAAEAIKKNLAVAKTIGQARILEMDALKALRLLAEEKVRFDLIFFDPPYSSPLYLPIVAVISDFSLLSDDGMLIVESDRRSLLPEQVGSLVKIDRRVYGDSSVEIFNMTISNQGGEI